MTPEPKDVQQARRIIAIIRDGEAEKSDDALAEAQNVVDAHEANIEVGRKQAEERQRAIDETVRRWPELGNRWVFDSGRLEFRSATGGDEVSIDTGSCESDIYFDAGDTYETRPTAVVIALLDATSSNTTANKLRDAIVEAITWIDAGDEAAARGLLSRALEAETWNR